MNPVSRIRAVLLQHPRLEPVRRRARRTVPGRRARWGNLRRTEPFDTSFGFNRGTPVDRVYVERFLAAEAHRIGGDVLEVKDSTYTRRFGAAGSREHVVDIDASNPRATLVADLCAVNALPTAAYDAIILTQTLQFLADPETALANLWRALRPGGVLLVTVPVVSKVGSYTRSMTDYWRWTPDGLRMLIGRVMPEADTSVRGVGNLVTTVAFLMGLAAEELRGREIDLEDGMHPLVVVATVLKTNRPGPSA